MIPPPPRTSTEWRGFLRTYSSEFVESAFLADADQDGSAWCFLDEGQRKARWLGYEPASEETVRAAEDRLGVPLPPAYRNFLLTSDGWRTISYTVDLRAVRRIGWFGELDRGLLDSWSTPGLELFADQISMLRRCLLISEDIGGSGQYFLLHADDVTDDGEWTAYEWWPGDGEKPEPYGNFAMLISELWNDATNG